MCVQLSESESEREQLKVQLEELREKLEQLESAAKQPQLTTDLQPQLDNLQQLLQQQTMQNDKLQSDLQQANENCNKLVRILSPTLKRF